MFIVSVNDALIFRIAKGSGYKTSDLQTLQEGQTLIVGGKELEVFFTINTEDIL